VNVEEVASSSAQASTLTTGGLGVEGGQFACDEGAEQGSPPPAECDAVVAPESTKGSVGTTAAAAAKAAAKAAAQASALAAEQRATEWAAKRKAKVDAVNARREAERLGKLTEQHTFQPDLAKTLSPQRRARAGLPKESAGQLACDSSPAAQPVQATMQQPTRTMAGMQCTSTLEEVPWAAESELEVGRNSLEPSSPCIGDDGSTAEPMSAAESRSSLQHCPTLNATPSDGGPCAKPSAQTAAQPISFSWVDVTDELAEVPGKQHRLPIEAASDAGSYMVISSSTEHLATSESTSPAATPRMVSTEMLPSTSAKLWGKAEELEEAFLAPPGPASLPQPRLGSSNVWKVQTPSVGAATSAACAAERAADPDAEPDQVPHFRPYDSSRAVYQEQLKARSHGIQQQLRQA